MYAIIMNPPFLQSFPYIIHFLFLLTFLLPFSSPPFFSFLLSQDPAEAAQREPALPPVSPPSTAPHHRRRRHELYELH